MFIPSLTESRRSAVTLRSSKKDFFSLDDWHEDPDEEEAMIKRARWSETGVQMSATLSLKINKKNVNEVKKWKNPDLNVKMITPRIW